MTKRALFHMVWILALFLALAACNPTDVQLRMMSDEEFIKTFREMRFTDTETLGRFNREAVRRGIDTYTRTKIADIPTRKQLAALSDEELKAKVRHMVSYPSDRVNDYLIELHTNECERRGIKTFHLLWGPHKYVAKNLSPQATKNISKDSPVRNSPLDGSVHQVEYWLKRNVHDPSSLEIMDWSPVQQLDTGLSPIGARYIVRCQYRAKNSLGGMVVENRIFHLNSSGEILSASEVQ